MGISNLAIAWGPTLFGNRRGEGDAVNDIQYQCKVIEVISVSDEID